MKNPPPRNGSSRLSNPSATRVYPRDNSSDQKIISNGAPSQTPPFQEQTFPENQPPEQVDQKSGEQDQLQSAEMGEIVRSMLEWRRMESEVRQIMEDPAKVPGYDQLPPHIQNMAKTEPMVFLMALQMVQEGFDFSIVTELQKDMDSALRQAGWDGKKPPTDDQLQHAEQFIMQELAKMQSREAGGGHDFSDDDDAEIRDNDFTSRF